MVANRFLEKMLIWSFIGVWSQFIFAKFVGMVAYSNMVVYSVLKSIRGVSAPISNEHSKYVLYTTARQTQHVHICAVDTLLHFSIEEFPTMWSSLLLFQFN